MLLPGNLAALLPSTVEEFRLEEVKMETVGRSVLVLLESCVADLYSGTQTSRDGTQVLLDIAWEKLNTGPWREVDVTWRYLYSYASLLRACVLLRDSRNGRVALRALDGGLLMGAPVRENLLSKMAALVCAELVSPHRGDGSGSPETNTNTKKLKTYSAPSISEEHAVRRVACPSLLNFQKDFLVPRRPLVVEDAIGYWPAFTTRPWSLEYLLNKIGPRTVPVEIGSKYTDESWSQKLMTVQEFVQKFIWNKDGDTAVGYLAQHELFQQIPELGEDVDVPGYCCLGESEEVDINVWFGPGGTVSPLHYDPKENLLTQLMGEKYVRLYAEECTPLLYPYDAQLLLNTSQVDAENPDASRFPLFSGAPYQECILRPGEMLYIPARCWHYVRSLQVSFSVSFWFR